jgi:hypothetical protein
LCDISPIDGEKSQRFEVPFLSDDTRTYLKIAGRG